VVSEKSGFLSPSIRKIREKEKKNLHFMIETLELKTNPGAEKDKYT
jgi:hypothetical protein